jgi:hypothetical protein
MKDDILSELKTKMASQAFSKPMPSEEPQKVSEDPANEPQKVSEDPANEPQKVEQPAQEKESNPRTGGNKSDDVSIEKMFYFGNK